MAFSFDLAQLENQISHIKLSFDNKFKGYKAIIEFCRTTLTQMRNDVLSNGFGNVDEEISFFKRDKKSVLSELIYYSEVYIIELEMPKADIKSQRRFLLKHSSRLNRFLLNHIDFVNYVDMDSSHMDEAFFTRKSEVLFPESLRADYELDPEFNTSHDRLLAKLTAFKKLLPYLQNKLTGLDGHFTSGTLSNLTWTSSKAALTELIYALHYARVINDGKADIQQIAVTLQHLFNFELGDIYKTFGEIKTRKKSRTKFLDDLSFGLLEQIEKSEI